MTQAEKKQLLLGWKELCIKDLSSRTRGGDDEVTEKLETDDSGEIAVIFSGDLKNARDVRIHKRITHETLRSALRDAAIKDFFRNKLPQTDKQSQLTDAQLRRIDAGIQKRIPLMLLPKEATILVALARGKVGAVGMYTQGSAVVNRAIMAITPKPDEILPDLLFYFFKSLALQGSIQEKLMPGQKTYAPIGDIKNMTVRVPADRSRQEQLLKRIEALLSDVNSARDALEKNQDLMDRLLESALREVFTYERMRKWDRRKLNDMVEIQFGDEGLQQSEYERYPFIKADDIDATVARLVIDRSRDLSAPAQGFLLDHNAVCLLYANTFTRDTFWRSRVAMPYFKVTSPPEKLHCNSDLFALMGRYQGYLHPRFLFWALQVPGFTAVLLNNRQPRSQLTIPVDQFQMAVLCFPINYAEQEQINAYLDAIQEQLERMKVSQEASRLAIDQMESSILDRAFQGEI